MSGCVDTHVGNYNCHSECDKTFKLVYEEINQLKELVKLDKKNQINLQGKIDKVINDDRNGYYFPKGMIDALEERLKKVESDSKTYYYFLRGEIDLLKEKIEILEEFKNDTQVLTVLSKLTVQLEKMDKEEKKPHKCPICEGHGKLGYPESMQSNCHSCDGKGIIWG